MRGKKHQRGNIDQQCRRREKREPSTIITEQKRPAVGARAREKQHGGKKEKERERGRGKRVGSTTPIGDEAKFQVGVDAHDGA